MEPGKTTLIRHLVGNIRRCGCRELGDDFVKTRRLKQKLVYIQMNFYSIWSKSISKILKSYIENLITFDEERYIWM